MAQAIIDTVHVEKLIKSEKSKKKDCLSFYISKNKTVKLYYSSVYRNKVVGLNISSTKAFILEKQAWQKFKNLIPIIDNFLLEK